MKPVFLLATLAGACTAPGAAPAAVSDPGSADADDIARVEQADFLQRLAQALAAPDRDDDATLMNTLEHLMPSWQSEQRRGRERPIEHIVTVKVVSHFDSVLDAFRSGPRERRLVAAWALGFARVPPNELGLPSRHVEAREALVGALTESDDPLLHNVLIGLWKLADEATPLRPLLDLMVRHHDPEVRANAVLAVGAVVSSPSSSASIVDNVLVALVDTEPKVRLHAAGLARRFPHAATTARLVELLAEERTPLVRASMASALGGARARTSASLLLGMLRSAREIEVVAAQQALAEIFGVDRGRDPAAWADLLP